jgi:DNA (cytosine-5)-methyltransferase 1
MRDAPDVTITSSVTPAASLVLSLFPGIDLFGRAFEAEGFCVVRGPDPVFGGDIRDFRPVAGKFEGIIGGPPCQPFSAANRNVTEEQLARGLEMLGEFCRCVRDSAPTWFLMENVARVPDVKIEGYHVQRLDVHSRDFGMKQRRLRHFQFGSRDDSRCVLPRCVTVTDQAPPCLASEGRRAGRRDWPAFCELQGLPPEFDLPSFTLRAKYQAVGNGVPIQMGRALAAAVRDRVPWWTAKLCACGCGRPVSGRQLLALASCRKREQRRRDAVTHRSPRVEVLSLFEAAAQPSPQTAMKGAPRA